MKRALLILALVLVPAVAHTHVHEAARVLSVQAETNGVAILVGWAAPTGVAGKTYTLHAGWGRNTASATKTLKRTMTSTALTGLEIELDGKPLKNAKIQSKLTQYPPGSKRWAITILMSQDLSAGPHTLTVRAKGTHTRLSFVDHSRGRATESSKTADSLTIQWTKSEVGKK